MELRSNTERLAIRFAPYIQELREFFKSRGLLYGSPQDIVPLAETLGSPGSFQDEMMSMLRSVIFRERGVVPRNELLELILVAIGGAGIDQAAQDVIAPVGALNEFVSEVLQSLKRQTFVEEDETEEAKQDSVSSYVGESQEATVASSRGGTAFAQEAEWNFEPIPEHQPVFHPLGGAFARAQKISPHFEEPGVARSLPPNPRILDAAELAVVPRVPAPMPPQHFFRNTMIALCFALAATLTWRQWYPVPAAQTFQASQMAGAAEPSQVPSANLLAQGSTAHDPSMNQPVVIGGRPSSTAPIFGVVTGAPQAASTQAMDTRDPSSTATHEAPPPSAPATGSTTGSTGNRAVPPPPNRRRSPRPSPTSAAPPAAAAPPNVPVKQGASVVSSGVMDGNLLTSPAPKYPRMASMAGVEGQVILQAVVSRNGTVVATHVLEGHHMLRGAAVHAVRSWRYRPYVVRGKPTDVATIVIVDFHLPH